MIFGISCDEHFSSHRFHDVPLRNGFLRVIRSLAVKIGLEFQNQVSGGVLAEWDQKMDKLEILQDFQPFLKGNEGASVAFQSADGIVIIDPQNQHVRRFSRRNQISDMSDMEDVKTAVCE